MSDYITNEAMLQKPDGWLDGSTNVVQFPKHEHLVRFMIARGYVQGRTLEQYVDAQTKELAKRTPFFEVTHREDRTVAGKRTLYMKCRSREADAELVHHRAALQLGDKFLLLMLVARATGEKEAEAVFDKALSSIKVREPGA